ncbi:MAG: NAD(P)-dependent glycerol-3-phosphate dehydrogenase [Betaproteobacteria bacterium]|nr:MAG: NAD(P)-dependent glycerol-3-phosphate dehydrogenase [Betaproteobacteria bacterium]
MRIAVLGAGAWGTALAISLASQHRVRLWARDDAHARNLAASRDNARYLPGCRIPDSVEIGADWNLVASCEALLCAVPMAGLRDVLARVDNSAASVPLVLASKGLERGSAMLPHQVVRSVLPRRAVCVLSGPSFAHEVARGFPAAVVLASDDADLAGRLARELHSTRLRMYSNSDLSGVEVAGATKNVMAIAAGICDGLGLGLNARAAMVTRGLAEISRLGLKLGGRTETFMGLAGLGDLILTCTGDLSRNRTVGLRLAGGASLDVILAGLGHVAEGVVTAYEVARLAQGLGVDMPITRAVCAVLEGAIAPAEAVEILLERDPRAEF